MKNYFPKRPSGAPLHILSKLYDVPVGFEPPPILRLNIAYFEVAEGGCCSISDDLSCSFIKKCTEIMVANWNLLGSVGDLYCFSNTHSILVFISGQQFSIQRCG